MNISEGDAFLSNDANAIRKKINSLGFFEEVQVTQKQLDENLVVQSQPIVYYQHPLYYEFIFFYLSRKIC